MKKDITLHITAKQYAENLEPKGESYVRELELEDSIELFTEGVMYNKNDARYYTYEESKEMGMEDAKTLLKLTDDTLVIRKYNESDVNMDMSLSEGATNITRFKITPHMGYNIEIYTNKLEQMLDEDGLGRISVDYRIKFDQAFSRRNMLDIEVSER